MQALRRGFFLVVLSLLALKGAHAQDFTTLDSGFSFSQISFTFPGAEEPYTAFGLFSVDYSALSSLGDGYVNVFRFDDNAITSEFANWVVQNLPVISDSGLPGVGTMFELFPMSSEGPASDTGELEFAPRPMFRSHFTWVTFSRDSLASVPKFVPPGVAKQFPVFPANYNAQGLFSMVAVPPGPPPPPAAIKFDKKIPDVAEKRLDVPHNVEQYQNQCCPGALANSLDYLNAKFKLPLVITVKGKEVTLENKPGVGVTIPPPLVAAPATSLVAQIDLAMNRQVPKANPAAGLGTTGNDVIMGKLSFLNDLAVKPGNLALSHQGYFCPAAGFGKDCVGIGCKMEAGKLSCDKKDIANAGLTSTSDGLSPDATFIKKAIMDDEADVEGVIQFNRASPAFGGHCIRIIGYGETGGVPFIVYIQDAVQGAKGGTGEKDGGYLYSYLAPPAGLLPVPGTTALPMANYVFWQTNGLVDLISEKFVKLADATEEQ